MAKPSKPLLGYMTLEELMENLDDNDLEESFVVEGGKVVCSGAISKWVMYRNGNKIYFFTHN
jgi:hypothetical protein